MMKTFSQKSFVKTMVLNLVEHVHLLNADMLARALNAGMSPNSVLGETPILDVVLWNSGAITLPKILIDFGADVRLCNPLRAVGVLYRSYGRSEAQEIISALIGAKIDHETLRYFCHPDVEEKHIYLWSKNFTAQEISRYLYKCYLYEDFDLMRSIYKQKLLSEIPTVFKKPVSKI